MRNQVISISIEIRGKDGIRFSGWRDWRISESFSRPQFQPKDRSIIFIETAKFLSPAFGQLQEIAKTPTEEQGRVRITYSVWIIMSSDVKEK